VPISNVFHTIQVNVGVNFQGVSYDPITGWSGTPTWNIHPSPAPVQPVKNDDGNGLEWDLNAAAVPHPFSASFATASAIKFSGTPAWTGGPPMLRNATTVTATDDFNNLPSKLNYYYTITVTLSGVVNGVTVTQGFPLDPDVQNEAGTANPAMMHHAG